MQSKLPLICKLGQHIISLLNNHLILFV